MALVDYSDSEDEDTRHKRPHKRVKIDNLPSLPCAFLDLYSSTVRSSTQDDPTLHAGRQRAIPHVEGNWPSHVYLEWHPNEEEIQTVSAAVDHVASVNKSDVIHSLLRNELEVTLPLHISLSRPLVLKTEQRELFLARTQRSVQASKVAPFSVQTKGLRWHPNEHGSRHFLVTQIEQSDKQELSVLLECCNKLAAEFLQPLLYASSEAPQEVPNVDIDKPTNSAEQSQPDQFHISLAWALEQTQQHNVLLPSNIAQNITDLQVSFKDVKIRIGQDITTIPLAHR